MCGVIGFQSDGATLEDIEVLKQVLINSRIRGKHASGIAWYDFMNDDKIKSFIKPVPIDMLLEDEDFDMSMLGTGKVSMIAHARYSTSDLRFNQPIIGDRIALVHNGVITQAVKDLWADKYPDLICRTSNDSELLMLCVQDKRSPFKRFPEASMSFAYLDENGDVRAYRNGLRPLWRGRIGVGTVYASTYDILARSGVEDIIKMRPHIGCSEQQGRSTHG